MSLQNVAYLEDGDISPDGKLKIPDNGKPVVIMLQGTFCGYCHKIAPDFQQATNALKDKANIATIVIDEQKQLGKEAASYIHNFKGVPTIVIFKNGKYSKTYEGNRTAPDIIEFVNKNI